MTEDIHLPKLSSVCRPSLFIVSKESLVTGLQPFVCKHESISPSTIPEKTLLEILNCSQLFPATRSEKFRIELFSAEHISADKGLYCKDEPFSCNASCVQQCKVKPWWFRPDNIQKTFLQKNNLNNPIILHIGIKEHIFVISC